MGVRSLLHLGTILGPAMAGVITFDTNIDNIKVGLRIINYPEGKGSQCYFFIGEDAHFTELSSRKANTGTLREYFKEYILDIRMILGKHFNNEKVDIAINDLNKLF